MQWNEFRSHIGHLSSREQQRVQEAFELGKRMHAGQQRKSGEPYFSHPIAVADMLADMGADADTIIAALLHDTIEDTPLTTREIETAFGPTVAMLIEGVTKLTAVDVAGLPNLNEQIETLRKMFTLMEKDIRIMVIKLVDRLHNMQTAEFLPPERQRLLAQETLDVYVKIADRLCMQDIRDELEGLSLSLLEPETFAKLLLLQRQNETRSDDVLKYMRQKIRSDQSRAMKNLAIYGERKTWDNLREQLQNEGTVVTGISAVTIAFVCSDLDCCYSTLGVLHQLWKRETTSFQDFINSPTINGYRGLHTTVILEDGTRVRCKIRTQDMHEYARKGIALASFGSNPKGLEWTGRISSLSQDTEGRSNEFWQTLQSDILGESIVIHGSADQSVTIPKGSTALDGAFLLFPDDATNIVTISIGGKNVPFSTPLHNGTSLNITTAPTPTVERSWLESAKTGLTVAKIRTALAAGKTGAEKMSLGKELLQRIMTDRGRGFIEEFDEGSLRHGLLSLGYPRMESLYRAIADGRVEPGEAYDALFGQQKKSPVADAGHSFRLVYVMDMSNTDMMDRLNDIHRKYRRGLSDINYKRGGPRHGTVMVKGHLTKQDQRNFVSELSAGGATHIRLSGSYSAAGHALAIVLLVSLWGLDPVVAGWLLLNKISSIDLTIIRFLTFWSVAAVAFAIQRIFAAQKFKPLNPLHPDLLLSGVTLFATALSTYLALTRIAPTQYIIFIIGGVVVYAFFHQKIFISVKPLMTSLVLGAVLIALSMLQGWSRIGFVTAVASSAGFVLYSNLSKRYQEQKVFIRARYPAYLFWVASTGFLLSLFLLPYATIPLLPLRTIEMAVVFSALFTTLPYILYFELMRRMDAVLLNHALPFVCVATMLGEVLITKSPISLIAIPLVPLFIWFYGRSART